MKRRAGKSLASSKDAKFKRDGRFSASNPYGRRDDKRQFTH